MARIAEDETRHAELSWAIAAWLDQQLSAAERNALQHARDEALSQLRLEVASSDLAPHDRHTLGWPATPIASELITQLAAVGA